MISAVLGEKEMFDQMHVPDIKTTRTKTIYDKRGASLDWIRF
jgi:hypothetical protein